MKLNISVIICTLNERKNIEKCIRSIMANNPKEVLVIDGGSKDKTVEIAIKNGVIVIKSEKGLSNQRQVGIDNAKEPFLAFVDADDRLDPRCLEKLLEEMINNNFDAIQARTVYQNKGNYWQKAMNFSLELISAKPKITNMVGRPALYRTDKIRKVGFDGKYFGPGIGCEDTDLAIRFEKMGFIQAIGTGVSKRIHSDNFKDVLKKIRKYGRGDARIVFKYPQKRKNILRHELWNYPVKRSWAALTHGGAKYVPFFVLMGLGRFTFFVPEYLRLKFKYKNYANFK